MKDTMVMITIQEGNKIQQITGDCCIVAVGNRYQDKNNKQFVAARVSGKSARLIACFIHLFQFMPKLLGLAAVAVSHIRRN